MSSAKACQSTSHMQQGEATGPDHWWKDLDSEERCVLTGFPLSLLPYPPFRFRVDPQNAENCKAVDAKYLVLKLISSGDFTACGRNLVESDVAALDLHMRRCNLGQFRLSRFLRLQKNVAEARSAEERIEAQKILLGEQENARKKFRKLQHIQSRRLKDLKIAKKTVKPSQNYGCNAPEEHAAQEARNVSRSQGIVLANPRAVQVSLPDVPRWADVSDEVVDMPTHLVSRSSCLTRLENLQCWRSSTESAKSDEMMFRRMENASWRLWASAADSFRCTVTADLLSELDKNNLVPQLKLVSSEALSHRRERLPHDRHTVVKIEELCDGRPSVLHNWRVSTKEARVVVLDGQARSRTENQLWRLMAISRFGDSRSKSIIQKVCAGNPRMALQLGERSPVISSPSPSGRIWLRTPSPEFRWAANARPTPILAPRIAENSTQNHGAYMRPSAPQPLVALPAAQVFGLMGGSAPLQSGVCMQPVVAMPSAAVPMMRAAPMYSRPLPEDYVCVAVPKHLVPQIQEELSQLRQ